MRKELLVIYDNEKTYAIRLYERLKSRFVDKYEVVLFTDEQKLSEYLANEEADILLASEEYIHKQERSLLPEYTICLTDEKTEVMSDKAIYKYMPVNELFRNIMSICASKETSDKGAGCRSKKCTLIGVYSPLKRCFQTTFCLTLGQLLAQEGKTLYLNFESFSGFESFERNRSKTDLLDLVYCSEVDAGSFSFRIGSFAEHIGRLDYIPPIRLFTKYSGICPEQWLRLLKTIEKETDYEFVILDLSESVNGLLSILSECDRIFTVSDEDRIAVSKMAQYERILQEYKFTGILDKTEKIKLPVIKDVPKDFAMLPYCDLATYIRKNLFFLEGEADAT